MRVHAALSEEYIAESIMRPMYEQADFVSYRDCYYKDKVQTSGVAYARKHRHIPRSYDSAIRYGAVHTLTRDSAVKRVARERVVNLFSYKVGPLRVLSMPGIMWAFERSLFRQRDLLLQPTEIYTVEHDAPIYQASVFKMPGKTRGIKQLSPHAIQTDRIACHYFTSVESLMGDDRCPEFDAAWLDFTGFISFKTLATIKHFWATRCRWQLAITSLNGRFHPRGLASAIKKAGGLIEWLTREIGQPIDEHSYVDGSSAMCQLVFRK
jgi:hypothetical protein